MDRRDMLKASGAGLAMAALMGQDALAQVAPSTKGEKKKILVIGAHPDDPESTCGGTMARLVREGHDVAAVYMTRGERGILGATNEEAARIRTAEAIKACGVIGCRYIFLSQIDGSGEITPKRYAEFIDLMNREKPDIVITHWPMDVHRDHAICATLTLDAWDRCEKRFDLFYCEVEAGEQSKSFVSNVLVDISDVQDIKKNACYCHESQNVPSWYENYHALMDRYYGLRLGVKAAEAFFRLDQNPTRAL